MHTTHGTKRHRLPLLFKKTVFRRLIAPALFGLATLLPAQTAWANCTATMGNINFGNVDLLNPGSITAQTQLSVTCTDSSIWNSTNFFVCFAADGGRLSTRQLSPRYLYASTTSSQTLAYNLYIDANYSTILGSPRYAAARTMLTTTVNVPRWSTSTTVNIPVYAKLTEPLSNVAPGQYANNFNLGSTALAFDTYTTTQPSTCSGISTSTLRAPFEVSATVVKNCTVGTPNDMAFGSVSPTATNLQGQTAFNVACTRDTPYNIGLKPSNNSTNGAGEMTPLLSGNAHKVPYQLRAESGINGRIWGNTATASATGNGVGGSGTGMAQPYTIYATVPSADYHYGDYRDKVTIQVNY